MFEVKGYWALQGIYWNVLRLILGFLAFALVAVAILGYFAYRKAWEETARTVFICKSCGSALTKLSGTANVITPCQSSKS